MKKDDTTVELSSGGKTSGPMSMKEFRDLPKKLREISSTRRVVRPAETKPPKLSTRPLVFGDQDPDSYFIEFPLKEDFEDAAAEYIACPGSAWPLAGEIGEELCKTKRIDLKGARIGYLWKRAGGQRGGKAILGKAVKANPLVRTFTNRIGFVVLSADHVQAFKLTRWQVEALIFHELAHFKWEEGTLNTYGHDYEGFNSEVEEYGLWKPDLKLAGDTFKQLALFSAGAEAK